MVHDTALHNRNETAEAVRLSCRSRFEAIEEILEERDLFERVGPANTLSIRNALAS